MAAGGRDQARDATSAGAAMYPLDAGCHAPFGDACACRKLHPGPRAGRFSEVAQGEEGSTLIRAGGLHLARRPEAVSYMVS